MLAKQLPPHVAYRSLAAWLAMVHPEIFNALAGKALSKGLGDWTDVPAVVDPNSLSQPPVDLTSLSPAVNNAANDAAVALSNSDSSSSWLSSIGSDVSGAIGAVGSFLATNTAPLLNAAGQYFHSQANQAAADAQAAVLQTQIGRAQAGQAAAPIAYVRNPVTGALQATYVSSGGLPPSYIAGQQPILQSAGGYTAYPLSRAGLSQLAPSGVGQFLSQYGLWIGAGVVALLLFSRMGNR